MKYYLIHQTLFYDQNASDYKSAEVYYSLIDMSFRWRSGSGYTKKCSIEC